MGRCCRYSLPRHWTTTTSFRCRQQRNHCPRQRQLTPTAAQNFLAALQQQNNLRPGSFKIIVDDADVTVSG
jgi:hypothetical protein